MTFVKCSAKILFFLLLVTFNVSQIQAEEATGQKTKSFLWEVTTDTSTAYILGSIHFANASFYPLNQTIENAFKESSTLVLELNPLTVDEQKMQAMVLQKGLYSGGETIFEHISPDLFTRLEMYLADNNMPLQGFLNMKPGMLSIALSTIQLMKLGYSPTEGIDIYFARNATNNKSIIELETMEEQLSLIFDMPDENSMLKYTLQDLENVEKLFTSITAEWKNGDSVAMDNLLLKQFDTYPELKPVIKKLFYDRNVKMTSKIQELMKANQKYFVVIGAGHLVGEKGILQLLKNEGYTIRQL